MLDQTTIELREAALAAADAARRARQKLLAAFEQHLRGTDAGPSAEDIETARQLGALENRMRSFYLRHLRDRARESAR